MAVLLLDSTYEPLKIISWEDAMFRIVTGDAEMVEETDIPIRSASREWKLPSVIRQFKKFKRKGKVQFSRLNIYMRDGWTCQYCKERKPVKNLTFDHVLPKAQGGKTNWENIVTACSPCNRYKDNRTPEQANMKLMAKPVTPNWLPAQMVIKMKKLPKQWEPYVDTRSLMYWTAELETS